VATYLDSTYWYREYPSQKSTCNWKLKGVAISNDYPFDYEFRFTTEPDTAFFPATYTAPFEMWNLTLNQKARFANYTPAPTDTTPQMKSTWTSGDELKLQETVSGKKKFTWVFTLSAPPLKADTVKIDTIWVYVPDTTFTVKYTIITTDTSVAPAVGDVIRTRAARPFDVKRDKFRIRTAPYKVKEITKETIENVKVVPNPYVISTEWELDALTKQLQFINLPSKCDIHIYTLTGEKVIILHHASETQSWEYWNLLSFHGQEVAYGLYLFVVETPDGNKKAGKFAIIK